jgi:hypothetical protein
MSCSPSPEVYVRWAFKMLVNKVLDINNVDQIDQVNVRRA